MLAVLLATKKIAFNWIVGIVANILWCFYAIETKQNALFFCNIILALISLYGFQQWTKKYEEIGTKDTNGK
jgi:nicotinamide riboside transporter PnuC